MRYIAAAALLFTATALISVADSAATFQGHGHRRPIRSSPCTALHQARRAKRGSLSGSDVASPSSKPQGDYNWCQLPAQAQLPTAPDQIVLIDTHLPTLMNGATNPTGAVAAVLQTNGSTYCFASSCPSCQIPLTKAKIVAPNDETGGKHPRLACTFCQATYSLGNGTRLAPAKSAGIFGNVVKNVFASKESGSLPMYQLGEQKGKLIVALD